MKLLSLEIAQDVAYGFVERNGNYEEFSLTKDNKETILSSMPVSMYRDYEHFRGVIGKFDPYTVFFLPVKKIDKLDFNELKLIAAPPL